MRAYTIRMGRCDNGLANSGPFKVPVVHLDKYVDCKLDNRPENMSNIEEKEYLMLCVDSVRQKPKYSQNDVFLMSYCFHCRAKHPMLMKKNLDFLCGKHVDCLMRKVLYKYDEIAIPNVHRLPENSLEKVNIKNQVYGLLSYLVENLPRYCPSQSLFWTFRNAIKHKWYFSATWHVIYLIAYLSGVGEFRFGRLKIETSVDSIRIKLPIPDILEIVDSRYCVEYFTVTHLHIYANDDRDRVQTLVEEYLAYINPPHP